MRKEPENAQAVVDRHHHRSLLGEGFAIEPRLRTGACVEAAGVQPEDHGTPLGGRFRGGPDVEIQAVFADARRRGATSAPTRLHAHRAKLIGATNAFPVSCRLRRMPAQIPHWRRRKRDAFIHTNFRAGIGYAGDQTAVQAYWIVGCRGAKDSRAQ
jgi:hypothetical protein